MKYNFTLIKLQFLYPDSVTMKCIARDLLGPRSTIERSLKDSSRQDHVILGGVVIGVHSWGGHAPPAKTKGPRRRSHYMRSLVRSARVDLKSVWKHANTDTTPTSRLIRDKDQLSGEKPVAWEHLCVRLQCSAESG